MLLNILLVAVLHWVQYRGSKNKIPWGLWFICTGWSVCPIFKQTSVFSICTLLLKQAKCLQMSQGCIQTLHPLWLKLRKSMSQDQNLHQWSSSPLRAIAAKKPLLNSVSESCCLCQFENGTLWGHRESIAFCFLNFTGANSGGVPEASCIQCTTIMWRLPLPTSMEVIAIEEHVLPPIMASPFLMTKDRNEKEWQWLRLRNPTGDSPQQFSFKRYKQYRLKRTKNKRKEEKKNKNKNLRYRVNQTLFLLPLHSITFYISIHYQFVYQYQYLNITILHRF